MTPNIVVSFQGWKEIKMENNYIYRYFFQPVDWLMESIVNGINSYFNLLAKWLNINTDEFSMTICLLPIRSYDSASINIDPVTSDESSDDKDKVYEEILEDFYSKNKNSVQKKNTAENNSKENNANKDKKQNGDFFDSSMDWLVNILKE